MSKTGQGQGQRVLRHRFGVGALRRRPSSISVDDASGEEIFNAGEWQLYPGDCDVGFEISPQILRCSKLDPDETVGIILDGNGLPAPFLDCLVDPFGWLGSDCDTWPHDSDATLGRDEGNREARGRSKGGSNQIFEGTRRDDPSSPFRR
jgi:hypothetical protein